MICPHCGKNTDEQPTLELTGEEVTEAVAMLPMIGERLFAFTDNHLRTMQAACPGVDIRRELNKAKAWLEANPTRRPRSNMLEFLRRWMTRAQNAIGGSNGRQYGHQAERAQIDRVVRGQRQ